MLFVVVQHILVRLCFLSMLYSAVNILEFTNQLLASSKYRVTKMLNLGYQNLYYTTVHR